ncbi:uncharacterized protein LOC122263397 [Penaeus japonicus]|uniref:uncharacterized protein LOC122263397 n=1 Tax=Penaeus japonicus TaxID=27405 RepID=UPI001C70B797|nr:uncharacterized protein LOC122263397 [Penaeus japonicus]
MAASSVDGLANDYWNWRIKDLPEFASFVGIHDQDEKLDDLSLSAHKARYEQCQAFLEQAKALKSGLTQHVDVINVKALIAELETYIEGFQYKGYLLPLCTMEGIHVDFERLISWMSLDTLEDYKKLLSRYKFLPKQLGQIKELMSHGISEGIVHHEISMKGVAASLGSFVVERAEDSPLWKPFLHIPNTVAEEEECNVLQEMARKIIREEVSPAFKKLQRFVMTEYTTRPDIAVTTLPDGENRYKQLLKFHTLTDQTAEEIHQTGLREVERIEGEMEKVVKALGYNISVREFSSLLRDDPKHYFSKADDLLAAFELQAKEIEPKMLGLFAELPKIGLKIEGDPNPNKIGAFYEAGSYDGTRGGVFQVGTHHFDTVPKYGMMTLSLHEGNPGHHYHRSYCRSSSSMPFFRRVMEDRNYGQAPSRFPMNTAYGEGWALYAEELGFEMGLYDDLYDRYGHYSAEIFRASRLVVDTGIHALGWTREEAIDYMFCHTAMTKTQIEKEVDRYITWPGQALAYKMGQLKISQMRERALKELGDNFCIKTFHIIVMESTGPLSLLEEEVEKWITSKTHNVKDS